MGRFGRVQLSTSIVMAVISCSFHGTNAEVHPIKPETRATIPEKPLERETVVVPCLRIPERNRSSWWMLIGPNGEVFIIGERTVRHRC